VHKSKIIFVNLQATTAAIMRDDDVAGGGM